MWRDVMCALVLAANRTCFPPAWKLRPPPPRKSPPSDPTLMMTTLLLFSLSNAMRVLNGRNSTARRLDFFLFSRFPLVFRIFFLLYFLAALIKRWKLKKFFTHNHTHTSTRLQLSVHQNTWVFEKKSVVGKKIWGKTTGGEKFFSLCCVCACMIFLIFLH